MNIKRFAAHVMVTPGRIRRAFPAAALRSIEAAIQRSEATHSGQIRFVVEGSLDLGPLFSAQSARERALEVFSQLRIWDTEHNNGVLIYLLLADRDVEIVADRGIHSKVAKVDGDSWEQICREMETAFRKGEFEAGVVKGIAAVSQHMASHFPATDVAQNELPDQPVIF